MKQKNAGFDFWRLQKENRLRFKILLFILTLIYSLTFYFVFSLILIISFARYSNYLAFAGIIKSYSFFICASSAGLFLTYIQYKISNKIGGQTIMHMLRSNKADKNDFLHNQVINIIDELKIAAGYRERVELMILPTLSKNVFSMDIGGLKVIGITEGLIFKFSRNEIQALIAQQFTHLVNGDVELISFICSTHAFFYNFAESVSSLGFNTRVKSRMRQTFSMQGKYENNIPLNIPALLIYIILSIAKLIIKLLNVTVSRNRVFYADIKAVEYTRNPMALVDGLYKISIARTSKNVALNENLSALFIVAPEAGSIDEKTGFYADLFSTHPPVKDRINALLQMAGVSIKHFYFEKGRSDYLKNKFAVEDNCKKNEGLFGSSIETDAGFKSGDTGELFFVYNKDNWRGPYPKKELFALDFLMPDSYINIAGSQTVGVLKDILPEFKFLEDTGNKNNCPRCGAVGGFLFDTHYEYVPVKKCARCAGYLIETTKIIRVLNRNIEQLKDDEIKFAETHIKELTKKQKKIFEFDNSELLVCPGCRQKMIRCFYNYLEYIVVDRCIVCNLTWFDVKELEAIQYYIEKHSNH